MVAPLDVVPIRFLVLLGASMGPSMHPWCVAGSIQLGYGVIGADSEISSSDTTQRDPILNVIF